MSETPQPGWLSRFRRTTANGAFIPEIDGLRFVAIASVVVFHVWAGLQGWAPERFATPDSWFAAWAARGWVGVEMFFVISGLVLGLPFAHQHLRGRRPVQLKDYFLRRLTRLEPPYLLTLALIFSLLVYVKGESASELLPHLLASAVYLHNVVFSGENPISSVAWSLEVEVQFYVLAPLLAAVFFRIQSPGRRRAALAAAALGATALSWLLLPPDSRAYLSILRFFQFFLMGFLLADLHVHDQLQPSPKPARWDLVGLLGWPALFAGWELFEAAFPPAAGRGSLYVFFVFPPALVTLYVAAFRGRIIRGIFRAPVLTTLGGMCYTIYLVHTYVLGAVMSRTAALSPTGVQGLDLAFQVAVAATPVVLVSAVFFVLIEKPCMRKDWPRRLWSALSPARTAARPQL